ncbi:penicillin-binding protein 1C [Bacteroidia bacterium]|nr:penicillin-binding protein 1C [Bacteroidia bacterium]
MRGGWGGLCLAILIIAYIICLPRNLFDVPYSTVVLDRSGDLLGARIAADGQWRFPPHSPLWGEQEGGGDKFRTCIIAFEDRRFHHHWGISPSALARATRQNINAGKIVSGGSTLTMQVIRLSRNKNRTLFEKLIESILATRLEFRCTKAEILALYASHAPFGGNVVGIDAAAWRYFGHAADRLSWAEAATLAVLPNAPADIHISKNRSQLLQKRNRLLTHLYNQKQIPETDYELALSEDLPGEPLPLPQIAPHLVNYYYKTRRGKITQTTINRPLQQRIEDLLLRWHATLAQNGINNLAAIVIDTPTGDTIAYCGNISPHLWRGAGGEEVDIIRAQRSTGSILKPFLYYAMLNEGEILPRTLVPDIPMNINGFAPQNFSMQYEGAVPAAEAVSRSLNLPLVYLLKKYSVPKFYDFLKEHRIARLPKSSSHYGLSLILGGAESSLGEITAAYADMGRSLLPPARNDRYSPAAVFQVFEALKEVNRPEEIDWRSIPAMQRIAWKTGTSYGFRDAWAVGVTPRYTVGVWAGNASGEGKPELIGARTAGPVMFDIFEMLPTSVWFEQPEGLTEAEVCRRSGSLKSRFCEESDTVLVSPKGIRTDACPYCTQDGFVLPPAWAWYYKQHHPEYTTVIHRAQTVPMQFIYPNTPNAKIHLPKQQSGKPGEITFELAHNNPQATVFWHINNEYITATRDFHKLTTILTVGVHSVTVVDDLGNTLSCRITVE